MSKKNRVKKPPPARKTFAVRELEVKSIKTQLSELGLTPEMDKVALIHELLDDFAVTGDPRTDKVKITGTKRVAHIRLCSMPHSASGIQLTYDKNV